MERSAWPKNLSSSRKQAIQELLDGQNPTKKIRHLFDAHSQTGNNTAQPLISEDLIVNVLASYSNTLSLSSSAAESYEVVQVPTNACVRSEISGESDSIKPPPVPISEESIKLPPVPTNACFRSEVSEESIKPPPVPIESIPFPVPRVTDSNIALPMSDCDESIVSSPIMDLVHPPQMPAAPPDIELMPEKPLPDKGKLLQAVLKAGPLLQTLLLAGPLPEFKHPPPPLDSWDIPR